MLQSYKERMSVFLFYSGVANKHITQEIKKFKEKQRGCD